MNLIKKRVALLKRNSFLRKYLFPFLKIFLIILDTSFLLIEQIKFNIIRIFDKPRIIDCTIFNNEIDLLDLRLDYLKDIVDIFVIVESEITFTARLKSKFNAESYLEKLPDKLRNKIRYIKIEEHQIPLDIKDDPWEIEKYVRNSILYGLHDLKHNDFLWLSDIDEIPKRENKYKIGKLSMFHLNYKMNFVCPIKWTLAKGLLGKNIIKNTPQQIRVNGWKYSIPVKNSGWHFSFLMDVDEIIEKVKSFSHTNLNTKEFTDPFHIQNCIDKGLDLFKREHVTFKKVDDLSFLPQNVKEKITYYDRFIAK